MSALCPCRQLEKTSSLSYQDCCEPFHTGAMQPPTAETLMRSRYSAFALKNADYLIKTHAPEKQTDNEKNELELSFAETQWTGLEIIGHQKGLASDKEGWVAFKAHFENKGQPGCLQEHSYFIKQGSQWLYVDGDQNLPKPGRNDPCWCGSQKKFKKCHGV